MRYLRLFESFDESKIRELCEKYNIKNYSINTDVSIDVYHGIIIPVTDEPVIIMDRLNDFLLTIGRDPVEKVNGYKSA